MVDLARTWLLAFGDEGGESGSRACSRNASATFAVAEDASRERWSEDDTLTPGSGADGSALATDVFWVGVGEVSEETTRIAEGLLLLLLRILPKDGWRERCEKWGQPFTRED